MGSIRTCKVLWVYEKKKNILWPSMSMEDVLVSDGYVKNINDICIGLYIYLVIVKEIFMKSLQGIVIKYFQVFLMFISWGYNKY